MNWDKAQKWIPKIDSDKCSDCGICLKACPVTPECIGEYLVSATEHGERFGLQNTARSFVSYDSDVNDRIRSASGGSLTVLLKHLLSSGRINGVLASVPIPASVGNPHYELKVLYSEDELDGARSSHYYPVCYDKALKHIIENDGLYVVVGVPCIVRAVMRLPEKIRSRILFTFCLACSHNVTGRFLDCMALQEGVRRGEPFVANLRDKFGGIPDANNFNNYFKLPDREIRRNRFETTFTDMWRNYFFAQESCLYCPDFFGSDADLSVKDAWGRLSSDPLGISFLIVRNLELVEILEGLKKHGKLYLEPCDGEEVFQSQPQTAVFKHVEICDRLVWKPVIYRKLKYTCPPLKSYRLSKRKTVEYWRIRARIWLSDFFYSHWSKVPVRAILKVDELIDCLVNFAANGLKCFRSLFNKCKGLLRKCVSILLEIIKALLVPFTYTALAFFRHPISRCPPADKSRTINVLIAGGYGGQNVGDEAQLGTVISQWKELCSNVKITILSPNPDYSKRHHGEHSEIAPRASLFESNKSNNYPDSNLWFRLRYRWIKPRMLLLAALYRKRLPLIGAYPHEIHLLKLIDQADVLHLSGGGYLTGMTLSRLWDNMLLINLADILGKPVILTGQTIGIFKDRASRKLAHWGLTKPKFIYLRDNTGSLADIRSLGIDGEHIKVTFDDALFCNSAENESVDEYLEKNGINRNLPFVAVNTHYFRQEPVESRKVMKRVAQICDMLVSKYGFQVLFVALHPSDLASMEEIRGYMTGKAAILDYDFDYRIAKGIIGKSVFLMTMKHHGIIFAMGSVIPTIAISLDDYYQRKNSGALGLFGQEKWLIEKDKLFREGFMEDTIERCVKELGEQRETISNYLKIMQKQDGEAIRKFMDLYGKQKSLV